MHPVSMESYPSFMFFLVGWRLVLECVPFPPSYDTEAKIVSQVPRRT